MYLLLLEKFVMLPPLRQIISRPSPPTDERIRLLAERNQKNGFDL
jgi:hypothetical protein